ncbi:hypothetical protein EBZ80_26910 [bacterium]|nr:hypothetical protein [bacterium]
MNRTLRLALVACVGTVFAASSAIAQPVREGEGSRREQLNSRELKPFASDAWSTLSDAKIGKLVNGNDIAGKPVLIVTWTSWLPTGDRALNVAKKAAETYAKDGLIVVVAHHPEGWNDPKASTLLLGKPLCPFQEMATDLRLRASFSGGRETGTCGAPIRDSQLSTMNHGNGQDLHLAKAGVCPGASASTPFGSYSPSCTRSSGSGVNFEIWPRTTFPPPLPMRPATYKASSRVETNHKRKKRMNHLPNFIYCYVKL